MRAILPVIARRASARHGNPTALLWIALLLLAMTPVAHAQADPFRSTVYPLPRFLSLNTGKVNVRTGPGEKYPIVWVYTRKHWPVEVVLEYDNWRKIRDRDGEEGWVHSSLLSGRRNGITQGPDYIPLRAKPALKSKLRVRLERGVIVRLEECSTDWCYAEASGYKGWIERKFIYGLYENERFD